MWPWTQDTSFETTKMENELGIKPVGVRDGLLQMKAERSAAPSLMTPITGYVKDDLTNLIEIEKAARATYKAGSLQNKLFNLKESQKVPTKTE